MEERILTHKVIEDYKMYLKEEERAVSTVEKYIRDIQTFFRELPEDHFVTKERIIEYKRKLAETYKVSSANSMLVALNCFFAYLKWDECRVRLYKVQKRLFRDQEKELSREEYIRLVKTAREDKNERLSLLIQTICSTGIRVSEHRFITVEALRCGCSCIENKGKVRTIILPDKLCSQLLKYCSRMGITRGCVFVSRNGKPLNRSNIWSEMKMLCEAAHVDSQKVFPHNLRHLFAVSYYQLDKDIVRLADVLGHSSIETTRIYTVTSGFEHARMLEKLQLLL